MLYFCKHKVKIHVELWLKLKSCHINLFVYNTMMHTLIPLKSENFSVTEYFTVCAIFNPHFWYISFCMRSCH